jgi:hypothetical protein
MTIAPKTKEHHRTHEQSAADKIDVTELPGVLAEGQNAAKIKGVTIDDTAKADKKVLGYDEEADRVAYITPAGLRPSFGWEDVAPDAIEPNFIAVEISHEF